MDIFVVALFEVLIIYYFVDQLLIVFKVSGVKKGSGFSEGFVLVLFLFVLFFLASLMEIPMGLVHFVLVVGICIFIF